MSFKDMGEELLIESSMRTTNIASMAKRVEDRGSALLLKKGLRSKRFIFYQEEGIFKRYQKYEFEGGKINIIETKYKGLSDEIEKDEHKSYVFNNERDPYAATIFLLKEVFRSNFGTLSLFYDDKSYKIPYQVLKDETIKIGERRYNTKKVLIKPEIKGKGLLRPKGDWYIWVDSATYLPVKMSVGFIIGSVDVLLERIEGDINLLKDFTLLL